MNRTEECVENLSGKLLDASNQIKLLNLKDREVVAVSVYGTLRATIHVEPQVFARLVLEGLVDASNLTHMRLDGAIYYSCEHRGFMYQTGVASFTKLNQQEAKVFIDNSKPAVESEPATVELPCSVAEQCSQVC